MKFPASDLDIRLSIRDHNLVVDMIPPGASQCIPQCEVLDIGAMPSDCAAWINVLDKEKEKL